MFAAFHSPTSLLLESHKKGLGPTALDRRWKLLTFWPAWILPCRHVMGQLIRMIRITQSHKKIPGLFSYVKLNFKAGLLSSTFWLKHSYLAESTFLGTGKVNRSDEFSEKFQTAFDPPPSFSESYIALFATKLWQKCVCSYGGTFVYFMILFPMRCM